MMEIIKKAAARIRLPEGCPREDLYSYGWEGYQKALKTYKHDKISFEEYAEWQAKYAIIDGLRRENPLVRGKLEMEKAIKSLVNKNERITDESLCEEMGIGKTRLETIRTSFVELDDDIPFHEIGFNIMDARILLSFGFSGLTSRELSVVWMHFFRGDTLADIGKNMRITESGACKIKKEALDKMKAAMTYDEV
jgi:RNA polymerase sigma factor FliA